MSKRPMDPRHHGFVPWDGDADVCVTGTCAKTTGGFHHPPKKMVRFSAGSKLRNTWRISWGSGKLHRFFIWFE